MFEYFFVYNEDLMNNETLDSIIITFSKNGQKVLKKKKMSKMASINSIHNTN